MAIIFYFVVFLFSFEKFCQKFRLSALKRIILSIYGNYLSFSFFHSKNSVTFRLLTLERIIRGFLLSDGISRLKNDFLPFRYSRTNERVFSRRKNYCRYVYIYIRIRFFIIPVSFSLFSISFVQISYNSSSNSSIVASKDLSIFILEI